LSFIKIFIRFVPLILNITDMDQIEINPDSSVGEIVTSDFRTAEIFRKAGIDFCCGGDKKLNDACTDSGVPCSDLIVELNEMIMSPAGSTPDYKTWDPVFLSDYIINTHHNYVKRILPVLVSYSMKIVSAHGSGHPELALTNDLISKLNEDLSTHMNKEETVLFPAIKEAFGTQSEKTAGIIKSEISSLRSEHDNAGKLMDEIRIITSGYRVPGDACNTYSLTFKLLQQFEDDLHVHVHLENNILFPGVLKNFK
jgi:regulator of cell morphogenesis and NO signaling